MERIKKFSTFRIIEHAISIVTFLILAVTGLIQRYHDLEISKNLIIFLGGIDMVRIIHRSVGMIFSFEVLMHILAGAVSLYRGVEPQILITARDFRDVIHNIRYYLGFESKPAATGLFTYRQKFEYWGIVTGSIIMSITGIILKYPVDTTKILPGILIPASKIIHSNHALIIVIIMVWHIYNAIFNPEVFPLNKSIFTGYVEGASKTIIKKL
jgi:formate dehydrogenase subunit gamma